MLTANILKRVFLIRAGDSTGTAFAIPWVGRTYLVTAAHIFDGQPLDKFDLFHNETWQVISLPVKTAGYGIDLAFIKMPETFVPGHEIELTDKDFYLSEDAFLVGFPLQLYINAPTANDGYPIPFAAKGCIAALPDKDRNGIFVSGQVDSGFSGGPVVIVRDPKKPLVVGVISYNLRKKVEQTFERGEKIIVSQPTNLIFCHSISLVTKLIDDKTR